VALVVVRAGVRSTVQDRGRPGYRGSGVPAGGAFDLGSLGLANALLGNDLDAAAVEMTLVGGLYLAAGTMAIALAGAPMAAAIRSHSGPDRPLRIPQSATLRAGDRLDLGGSPIGARTYLAVRGGWRTPPVMGSRSAEVPLRVGDRLPAEIGTTTPDRRPVTRPRWRFRSGEPIRVVNGPDADPDIGDARLLESGPYLVTPRSDRMGLRLEGPPIAREADPDRPSAPVAPGAIQVAGGLPIILGVAGGTMGGYLHLAHVISADLDRIGQLGPGDLPRFRRIEVEEAREIDRTERLERARWLARIANGAGP